MRFLLVFAFIFSSVFAEEIGFQIVKKIYTERPGNIAVSSKGDIFITVHPVDEPRQKVVKIGKNGEASPFATHIFSSFNGKNQNNGIVNSIGIYITNDDTLWVLDMGGKVGEKTVSPKFVLWDLKKDALKEIITIPSEVIVENSFLQDFAIDEERGFVFIADMTKGGNPKPAIIVINLQTKEAKRILENNKMLVAEKPLMAEGMELAKLGINPISIDPENEWVYFGVMSEASVLRIKAKDLENFSATEGYLASKIQNYGYKPHSDGFKVDGNGNIYVGDVQNSEIGVLTKTGYKSYIKSPQLTWVDGLFIGKDGFVYAVVNQLNRHKDFSGTEKGKKPYLIIKFKTINQ